MTDALSIAVSGLLAQGTRLAATASNIANASTEGTLPGADSSAPASTVYKPLQVSFTSVDSGGVVANVIPRPQGYSVAYDPTSPYANGDGYVAAPDVDLNQEAVNLIETRLLYKANLSVIKTQDEMLGDLLNTIA
ncbi:MAG: flagellar biosynthesis protein FlgC [Alphaproteobacteria bacterium]|nr:flagellar biosynthesis protein FlgC [Alphaproteobacteria bacterium]